MVKHRRRRRRKFRAYLRGNINLELSFAGLAANDLASQVVNDVVGNTTFVSSLKASFAIHKLTPTSGVGPILFGVAHSDYSDAEIEAWIEQANSWEVGDLITREVTGRKIKQIGMMGATSAVTEVDLFQDGKDITTKLNWILNTSQNLNFWVYNAGNAAVASSTPVLRVQGHANLWPQ